MKVDCVYGGKEAVRRNEGDYSHGATFALKSVPNQAAERQKNTRGAKNEDAKPRETGSF
jgi:hypothetical protein